MTSNINIKNSNLLLRALFLAIPIGIIVGSSSAFFLLALEWVTALRINNDRWLWILPIAGGLIAWTYSKHGHEAAFGNNQIIKRYERTDLPLRIIMAPLVLWGTLLTHLVGGSAGREGTAVQMGASIATIFTKGNSNPLDKRLLMIMGVSAGFASVFGTPLAGAVFGVESMRSDKSRFIYFLPALVAGWLGDLTCDFWSVEHTHYSVTYGQDGSFKWILASIIIGVGAGFAARMFVGLHHFWGYLIFKRMTSSMMRGVLVGVVLLIFFSQFSLDRYAGLGVPIIVSAFEELVPLYDWILKLIFTTFTLSGGLKGGEVTPLFFIGATLGNSLGWILPIPLDVLAAMGFVAVFAGATNAPIASIIMGFELFGLFGGGLTVIPSILAYYVSSNIGIYGAQQLTGNKLVNTWRSLMVLFKKK